MLKPKKIIQILSALLLLVVFWITFALIQGLFERKISNHQLYIPENAESVLKIEGEALIKTFVQEVLLAGSSSDKLDNFSEGEPLGMDYLSTFYVFTLNENSKKLTGILVNILDEKQFNRAMKSEQTAGTGFAVQDGVGLMLYDTSESPLSMDKMNDIAAKIIATKSGFDLTLLVGTTENAKLNYWQKEYTFNDGSKSFKQMKLAMTLEGSQLKIKGKANFNSTQNRIYPALKKNDLSIQSQFIPNKINEFWVNQMQDLGLKFPKLSYVCGNYHYSEPSPIPDLKVLPHFDGIYAFEENFQIRIPLIAMAASGKINVLNLQSFNIGNKTIYYEQIDKRTVYLGQSKYNPTPVTKNAMLEVSGNLKQLLEIRNGGMISRLLALSSEYNAAERFLSGIKSSEFYIKDNDGKTVDMSMEMEFEGGKSAMNEMVRLVMDLGVWD